MIDFDEIDKKLIVEYNENKNGKNAYLWNQREFPAKFFNVKNGISQWITVSDAFKRLQEHKWHFYPAGQIFETHLIGFELNTLLSPDCTDTLETLCVVGKKRKFAWNEIQSLANIVDTDISFVNKMRRFANFIIGFTNESSLSSNDTFDGNKDALIQSFLHTKEKLMAFTS